ncbi:MAG TPA: DUF4214 domain-containing protein [Ramlibacter sp.]|nr:DUF4214 domain-containing protein [Ramlibacter sp.]
MTNLTSIPRLVDARAQAVTGTGSGYRVTLTFDSPVRSGDGFIWFDPYMPFFRYDTVRSDNPAVVFEGNTIRVDVPTSYSADERVRVGFTEGAVLGLDGSAATHWPTTWFTLPQPGEVDEAGPVAGPRYLDSPIEPAASPLQLYFDEILTAGSGAVVLRDQAGTVVESFDVADSQAVLIEGPVLTLQRSVALELGTRYTLEFPAGVVLDTLANPTAGQSWAFRSSPIIVHAGASGGFLAGGDHIDALLGDTGDDVLAGLGGDDFIAGGDGIDTAVYRGPRADYRPHLETVTDIDVSWLELRVPDMLPGRDGNDTVIAEVVEVLRFTDSIVHTEMLLLAYFLDFDYLPFFELARLPELEELYVGFFDRIPEASGLLHWLDALKNGATIEDIAQQFYLAGVQFGLFPAGMDDSTYVATVYGQVLGRPTGHAQAPSEQEIAYWRGLLEGGSQTRSTMVLQMLQDVHAFDQHPVYGWVADLLANKTALAHFYAVEQGLGRFTAQDDIAFGQQLADLVTPEGYSQAIALIGLGDAVS